MTEQEINKVIAEYCGWKYEFNGNHEDPEWYWIPPNNPDGNGTPPDYCNDLNEMHEAEKVIIERGDEVMLDYDQELSMVTDSWRWNATAAQRASAFLETLGLWEEAKNEV